MDVIPTTIAERIAALSRNAGLMTANFADYGLTSDEATAFQGLVDDAVTAQNAYLVAFEGLKSAVIARQNADESAEGSCGQWTAG